MKSKAPRRQFASIFILFLLLSLCIDFVRCDEDSKDQDSGDQMDDQVDDGVDDWADDADMGSFQDDYDDVNYKLYYTTIPTKAPTKDPTFKPTSKPTRHPTESPSKNPTMQPTEAPDDFYVIEEDDYTYEAQQSRMSVSNFSDVVLCLMCTFFWVLWLVGTIFPNRINHLYKSEGVVVRGDVIDSYQSGGRPSPPSESQADDDDEHQDDGLAGMNEHGHGHEQPELERDFDGMNLPTYHAIVSYVVPGRIVRGRKKVPSSYNVGSMGVNSPKSKNEGVHSPTRSPRETNMETLSRQLSLNPAVAATAKAAQSKRDGTPPRQRITNATATSTPSLQNTNNVSDISSQLINTKETPTIQRRSTPPRQPRSINQNNNPQIPFRRSTAKPSNAPALFDATTRSFDSSLAVDDLPERHNVNASSAEKVGFYKYNPSNTAGDYFYDDSDVDKEDLTESGDVLEDDQWEDDPERIGNFFESVSMNLNRWKNPRSKTGTLQTASSSIKPPPVRRRRRRAEPVLVKKKFETSELLRPGVKNVEIIVLPGNPVSGVLKIEFEEEEEYMLNYQQSEDPTVGMDATVTNGGAQMGDMSAAMIGVVLAAVSTCGAVHGVLTLPYQKRGCEFHLQLLTKFSTRPM